MVNKKKILIHIISLCIVESEKESKLQHTTAQNEMWLLHLTHHESEQGQLKQSGSSVGMVLWLVLFCAKCYSFFLFLLQPYHQYKKNICVDSAVNNNQWFKIYKKK